MFLVASHQIGAVQDIVQYADEAAFLKHFISKPVSEWFDEWDPNEIDSLKRINGVEICIVPVLSAMSI